jgi:hypothetical protein
MGQTAPSLGHMAKFPSGLSYAEYCRVFPLLGIFLGAIGKSLDHRPMRRRIANREGTKIWKLPYTKLQNTHRLADTRDKSYTNGKFLRFNWLFAKLRRDDNETADHSGFTLADCDTLVCGDLERLSSALAPTLAPIDAVVLAVRGKPRALASRSRITC